MVSFVVNFKSLIYSIKKGIGLGLGILLVLIPISFAGIFFMHKSGILPESMNEKMFSLFSYQTSSPSPATFILSKNHTDTLNPYLYKPYQLPTQLKEVLISSVAELTKELEKANRSEGGVVFILEDGVYTLDNTLYILADNIAFISRFGLPEKVIIQGGPDLNRAKTGNLFRVSGSHFVLNGITLQNARNHLVQIGGEQDADFPVIINCILQDSFEQMVKVSYDKTGNPETSSDFGLIENCIFNYTAGIGPQDYIGGIDAHAINGWIIRNNTFKNISSPKKNVAQYAIHLWNNANNNLVENNLIEDCDRGIGFGMRLNSSSQNIAYSNLGGVIRNNTIIHSDNDNPFSDTGIGLEDSALTLIENNKIWLGHNYPNAIEYRFSSTTGVIIHGNITNKKISSRNGGVADVFDNITDADLETILAEHLFTGK